MPTTHKTLAGCPLFLEPYKCFEKTRKLPKSKQIFKQSKLVVLKVMGPDPEKLINRDNSFETGDYVVNNQLDDEMDIEENQMNDGYFMLHDSMPENPANDDDSSESENDEDMNGSYSFPENNQYQESAPNVPVIRSSSTELVTAVWNNTSSSSNIEITNEKSEQITQIMSKITLPNPPSWLNEINPENILDRIRNKNKGTSSDK